MIRFRKDEDGFDWRSVPAVDPDEVDRWMGATDAKDRQFPLQLALQVHDEIETRLMQPGEVDDADLREARGGLKALKRFAELYTNILESKRRKAK